ncbi:type II toxin-antitoxin system VapC family toxin [Moorella naiadis]|uniref:type II toxin-antitoxin system VapC family toxin n=1 Tax=Moorella naiadis (nom. illeg.) TaxID=3093670 RepID=UPI003D9C9908
MAAFLIDTCVLIDHLTGRLAPPVSAWLEQTARSGALATSVVVYHELLTGAKSPRAQAAIKTLLETWTLFPVNRAVAERAAALRRELATQGKPAGMADSLIAATAELRSFRVVTANLKDFPGALAPEEAASTQV